MREFEVRRCPKCKAVMKKVDGSERTARDKIFFRLRCPRCGHEEQDWYDRPKSKR